MSFGASTMVRIDEDRVIEGFRVPPALDNVTSVTFVLTQEPGKLKPKDLKAAIERNRAEKEQRAEEQKKLRDEGGGAGMLDLRGILSEERLNSSEGDPFKRQLREMAFLADVDDVEKLEIEKGFRISEDYLGSSMLSKEDIDIVYKQRRMALLHKQRGEWRTVQGRTHTGLYPPTHPHIKAGTSADTAKLILSISTSSSSTCAMEPPHFDPNRNDIWAKRMNALRRLISLVGKWLIRKRVKDRMAKVINLFSENNAFTREEIRAFIENNASSKQGKKTGSTAQQQQREGGSGGNNGADPARPASVSSMVFMQPNESLLSRERNAAIQAAAAERVARGESEISADMARRVLFPQCNPSHGGSGSREALTAPSTQSLVQFDDRTFFQLKVQPEYLTIGYFPETIPSAPVYFPTCLDKTLRLGAPEEWALRPPADAKVNASDIESWIPDTLASTEPSIITKLRLEATTLSNADKENIAGINHNNVEDNKKVVVDTTQSILDMMPIWMTEGDDVWSAEDVNFLEPVPHLRTFGAMPRRSELDADWVLRPDSEVLHYELDNSLRSSWCSKAGFLSTNIYLLGNQESRNRDPPPAPGPNLSSDYFLPDGDRHRSGLGCYSRDHLRGPLEWDADVPPLQQRQDKRDYLTDSESDNEDGYGDFKPTLARVRKLLIPPPPKIVEPVAVLAGKGGKDAKKGAPAAAPAPAPAPVVVAAAAPLTADTLQSEAFGALEEGQRREEQVELLRDRKTLDLESTILRARKTKFDEFANKLCAVSQKSRCLIQALPVQMPFHSYEEEVYKLVEPRMPVLRPNHVELDLSRSTDSMPNLSLSMSHTGAF